MKTYIKTFIFSFLTISNVFFFPNSFSHEKAANQKKVLLFSGGCKASDIKSKCYWDTASTNPLYFQVKRLLISPQQLSAGFEDIAKTFKEFCRPALDSPHHWFGIFFCGLLLIFQNLKPLLCSWFFLLISSRFSICCFSCHIFDKGFPWKFYLHGREQSHSKFHLFLFDQIFDFF